MRESERLNDWHDRLLRIEGRGEYDAAILNEVRREIFSRYLDALHEETRKECANG